MNDFAVIIISHKRPECKTVERLRQGGYTGKIFIIVDDEDPTLQEYIDAYGDAVKVFHKEVNFDIGDNFDGPNSIATFARNFCWKVAEAEGLKTFLLLDDDLKSLTYRYVQDGHLRGKKATNLDWLFSKVSEWILNSNLCCISFGNDADYIGGIDRMKKAKRTATCSFFLRTDRKFDFVGRYREDTIAPLTQNKTGNAVIGFNGVQAQFDVWVHGNAKGDSGCQSAYKTVSKYALRFYELLWHPDCVFLPFDGEDFFERVRKDNAYPLIISDRYQKK